LFLFDISGSTIGALVEKMINGKNVIFMRVTEFLEQYVRTFILENPDNNYGIILYNHKCTKYFAIPKVNPNTPWVELPVIQPTGTTNVANALYQVNLLPTKFSRVIVATDGDFTPRCTCTPVNMNCDCFCTPAQIWEQAKKLTDKGTKISIMAVTPGNNDFHDMVNKEQIVGVQLTKPGVMGDHVRTFEIFNAHNYQGTPFVVFDKPDASEIRFLGHPITTTIHQFIGDLINCVYENKDSINWGPENIKFKNMLMEIGYKLLPKHYLTFPRDKQDFKYILQQFTNLNILSEDDVVAWIYNGFDANKNRQNIDFLQITEVDPTKRISQLAKKATYASYSNA
jgi:hypothetical protein